MEGVRALAAFGLLGLLFVFILFLRWHQLYPSDPGYMLAQAKLNTHQFFAAGANPRWPAWFYQSYVVAFWPASAFLLLTPAIAALGYVGGTRALRRGPPGALPLVLGFAFICGWLAYAAFRHDILAQWRYALILAVVLAIFVPAGIEAVRERFKGLTERAVWVAVVGVAVATQAGISVAAYRNVGVLGRQFTLISPIRADQFSSRDLLQWARGNLSGGATLLVTAHAADHAYFSLEAPPLVEQGRVVVESYYLGDSQLVHTRASLVADLVTRLRTARFLATNESPHTLGLRDGLSEEVIQPTCAPAPGNVCSWQGVRLRRLRQFGPTALWEVL